MMRRGVFKERNQREQNDDGARISDLALDVPAGWHRVGKEGTKQECSAYVDEVWTDMRPRSLREAMEGASGS